jgi:hypothetical protein
MTKSYRVVYGKKNSFFVWSLYLSLSSPRNNFQIKYYTIEVVISKNYYETSNRFSKLYHMLSSQTFSWVQNVLQQLLWNEIK